jgi:hypothetical protein
VANTRLPILPHLPPEEFARRYRTCHRGVEKTHRQALRLMTRPEQPLSPAQAAARVGLTPARVRTVPERRDAEGPARPADRRPARDGGRPKPSAGPQAA